VLVWLHINQIDAESRDHASQNFHDRTGA